MVIIKQRLTDLERQRVIAEYVAGGGAVSQQQLADKYGVSRWYISNILRSDKAKETKKEYQKKSSEAMREFLDDSVNEALELFRMDMQRAKETIPDASLHEAMGSMKILYDIFGANLSEPEAGTDYADMRPLAELLKIDEGEGDGEV